MLLTSWRHRAWIGDGSAKQLSAVGASQREEIEKFLQERARDVVHSEVTNSGDFVECMPLETQPSLMTPEMRGQKFANPPATRGPEIKSDPLFPEEEARIEGGDICPTGTVPRLGITRAVLEEAGSVENYFQKFGGLSQPLVPGAPGSTAHSYGTSAVTATNKGGSAVLNIWTPYTDLHDFSLSQIWLSGGAGTGGPNALQTIEAGWQRYPDKYGNTNTHLFTFYTKNNYQSGSGCYNSDCSGFVQISTTIFPGASYTNVSTANGPQYTISVWYEREPNTGHWMLYHGGNLVGYYPGILFNAGGIRTAAATVTYGGEVASTHRDTNMGSSGGNWPSDGYALAAYTRSAQYSPSPGVWADASPLIAFAPEPTCYDIILYNSMSWGQHMYFGGPGRSQSLCP